MNCTNCKKIEEIEEKLDDHSKRLSALEEFEKWARPILEAVKTIKNDNRWMIVIFVSFVGICTYVYQTDIKDYIKENHQYKIEVIEKFNDIEKKIISNANSIYKDTIKNLKDKE